jgi:glutathione peroxidase
MERQRRKKGMSVYDFKLKTLGGEETDLTQYRGNVMVIVNTASKCGFTPQYEDLQKLYEKYREQGLVVLGFPSNQFGAQEPGSAGEIGEFCKVNYGVTFPLFEKTDVRGPDAHPLFRYLTEQAPFQGFDAAYGNSQRMEAFLKEKLPDYWEGDGIKWNFTKFLVDREGRVVRRFEPTAEPLDMVPEILQLI